MKRMNQSTLRSFAAFVCLLAGVHTASATTHTWTNVFVNNATYDWSGATNWNSAGVPVNDGTADVVFSNNLATTLGYAYTVRVDAPWAGTTGTVRSLTFLGGGNANDNNTLSAGAGVQALSIGEGGIMLDTNGVRSARNFDINLHLAATQKWFIEMKDWNQDNRILSINKDLSSPPDVNWLLGGRTRTAFVSGSSSNFLGQVILNGYVMFVTTNQYKRFGANPVIVNNSNNLVFADAPAMPKLVFNDLSVGPVALQNAFVLQLTNTTTMFEMNIGGGPSASSGTGTVIDITNSISGRINSSSSSTIRFQSGYPLWDSRYVWKISGNNSAWQGPTNPVTPSAGIDIARTCFVINGPHALGTNNSLAIIAGPRNNRLTGVPTSILATDGNTVNSGILVPIANQSMTGNRNPQAPVAFGLSGTGAVTFAGSIKVETVGASNLQCEVHMLRFTAPSNGLARFTGNISDGGAGTFGTPMQILGLGDVGLYGTNTAFRSQTLIRSGRLLLGSSVAISTNVPVNLGDRVSFPAGGGVRVATVLPLDKLHTTPWLDGTFFFTAAPTVDGVVPVVGDRVLVKDENANPQRHGVYTVTTSTNWSRAVDLNEAAEFVYGLRIPATAGTVNAGRAFFLFNREEIAYAPLVMNSAANNTFAFFGFNEEPAVNPDVALLTAAAVTVSNKVVVSDNLSTGTSTLGGTTAQASLFLGDITLNRDVQLTAATGGTATFSGAFSGPGGIIKTGGGTVVLTAAPASTGRFTVKEGTLEIQGNLTLTNELTIAANSEGSGKLAVGGSLTLDPGAQLTLSVTGTLDRNLPYYTLVTWTTTRFGSFAPVVGVPNDWRVEYRSNSLILFPLRGTMIQIL